MEHSDRGKAVKETNERRLPVHKVATEMQMFVCVGELKRLDGFQ